MEEKINLDRVANIEVGTSCITFWLGSTSSRDVEKTSDPKTFNILRKFLETKPSSDYSFKTTFLN